MAFLVYLFLYTSLFFVYTRVICKLLLIRKKYFHCKLSKCNTFNKKNPTFLCSGKKQTLHPYLNKEEFPYYVLNPFQVFLLCNYF